MQHFALIGSGFMGNVHAASLARHPAVSFDLVADIDEERAGAGLVQSRRRWRWAAVAAVVALVALAASVLPGRQVSQVTELALEPGSQAVGEITIESKPWGTAVDISLADLPPHDRYIAWVVSRDGEWQQIAAWGPTSGARAIISGASSIPTSDIDEVVITAYDPGDTIATAKVPSG